MKVLYIFCDATSSEGVFKKVFSKIKYLNSNGVETLGLFFREDEIAENFDYYEKVKFLTYKTPSLPKFYHRRYIRDTIKPKLERKYRNQAIFEKVSSEVSSQDFDLIVFRYPNASVQLLKFMKTYGDRVIFECNANELFVLEKFAKNAKNKKARLAFKDEIRFSTEIMRLARGVISVGYEVEEYQIAKSNRKIKSKTIANGLDLNIIKPRNPVKIEGKKVRILFLTGSPRFVDGMDLILRGLEEYKGEYDLKLIIAGPISIETEKMVKALNIQNKVEFTGLLKGEDLDQIFNECHFAIGTMALHRKGLYEHSALKVCEYIGRGIPFVLSYDDTNILGKNDISDYFLKLPSGDVNLDFNCVIPWVVKVLEDSNYIQIMRKYAEKNIDYQIKMKELKDFLIACNEK